MELINSFFLQLFPVPLLAKAMQIVSLTLFSLLLYYFFKKYVVAFVGFFTSKSKNTWDDALFENRFFSRLTLCVPFVTFYLFSPVFGQFSPFIKRFSLALIIFALLMTTHAFFNAVNSIYEKLPLSSNRPIKGILQSITLIFYLFGFIVIASVIMGKSPALLLSGLGAMTAILMLVFKDTILSFVAGIQITYNNNIKKGDWIVMTKYSADGTVIDIALHTVKIQNWDKTITVIPTHKFLEESFTNWRGMEESGGRRVCRSLFIDLNSVAFLSENQLNNLKDINILQDYLNSKLSEINKYNSSAASVHPANLRNLTNIGTFRAYILNYLLNHSHVHNDMTLLVRQLEAQGEGLPLQLYFFTKTTEWIPFESIQSDIFDHLFSIAPLFGLSLFQKPAGRDVRTLFSTMEEHNG